MNINPFIGACVEPGNIFLLTQYCNKGSLQVIIENYGDEFAFQIEPDFGIIKCHMTI